MKEENTMFHLESYSQSTQVLLSLAVILAAGLLLTRVTDLIRLPKVTGYILAGVLIGPYALKAVPAGIIGGMSFFSDIALSFIAFSVGKYFKRDVLQRAGKRIVIITLAESLTAGVFVMFAMRYLFHLSWEFSLVLGAISTATAPASTMMTIKQYKAKGPFIEALLQIVALDDAVCLIAYSTANAVASAMSRGQFSAKEILLPIVLNVAFLAVGAACGFVLAKLIPAADCKDTRLILAVTMVFAIAGLCAIANVSPLLTCMVFSCVYVNLTDDKKLYRQINNFTPPIMAIFFILSGMNLNMNSLRTIGIVGVGYFLIRIAGKYLGTYVSCRATGSPREEQIYLGLGLMPQAGVSIGLAFLGARVLPEAIGQQLLTIILASSVLYEMIGPACAKFAIFRSGSVPGVGAQKTAALPQEAKAALPVTGRRFHIHRPLEGILECQTVDGESFIGKKSESKKIAEKKTDGAKNHKSKEKDTKIKNGRGKAVKAPDRKKKSVKGKKPERKVAAAFSEFTMKEKKQRRTA